MYTNFVSAIFFILIIRNSECVTGSKSVLKWIPLNSGDKLPKDSVLLVGKGNKYVGRARHFDEILPAEIYQNGTAFISSCNKEISKEKFEILTKPNVPNVCLLVAYSSNDYLEISENIVRLGSAWNGEPIYIGTSNKRYNDQLHITSIYLTSKKTYSSIQIDNDTELRYLRCESETDWIDTSSNKVPNNTVSGGKSEDGYDIYVARLKRGCEIVTGQVIPEIDTSTALLNNGEAIESPYCQVLVGEINQYTWVSASDGEIPDYAVVNGKYGSDVSYVARFNESVRHLTHSEAVREMYYEILVNNP